mmetsp:Transcript_30460/g.59769  ORF Transcript_30460/g.59769 Transcript_30460/m.59769 type:complete len:166 (+) Transcript_30460:15-512(+)
MQHVFRSLCTVIHATAFSKQRPSMWNTPLSHGMEQGKGAGTHPTFELLMNPLFRDTVLFWIGFTTAGGQAGKGRRTGTRPMHACRFWDARQLHVAVASQYSHFPPWCRSTPLSNGRCAWQEGWDDLFTLSPGVELGKKAGVHILSSVQSRSNLQQMRFCLHIHGG